MNVSPTRGMSLYQKLGFRWKQGWNEIPEVMGSSVFALIGTAILIGCVYKFETMENNTKRYKVRHMIMRPDDPRVKLLKRFPDSPQLTKTTV